MLHKFLLILCQLGLAQSAFAEFESIDLVKNKDLPKFELSTAKNLLPVRVRAEHWVEIDSDYGDKFVQTYRQLKISVQLKSQAEFNLFRQLYSQSGTINTDWNPTRHTYNFEDFLPTNMRSLLGKRYLTERNSHSNCWGTAYEIARNGTKDFTAFYATPGDMLPWLLNSKYSSAVKEDKGSLKYLSEQNKTLSKIKRERALLKIKPSGNNRFWVPEAFQKTKAPDSYNFSQNSNLKFGDMLIVTQEGFFETKNDTKLANRTLVHAAIYIDKNLYFEKTAYNEEAPYRLVTWNDIQKTYGNFATKGTRYVHRRFSGKETLPNPAIAFASGRIPFAGVEFEIKGNELEKKNYVTVEIASRK